MPLSSDPFESKERASVVLAHMKQAKILIYKELGGASMRWPGQGEARRMLRS
jgi:hypothetical protein